MFGFLKKRKVKKIMETLSQMEKVVEVKYEDYVRLAKYINKSETTTVNEIIELGSLFGKYSDAVDEFVELMKESTISRQTAVENGLAQTYIEYSNYVNAIVDMRDETEKYLNTFFNAIGKNCKKE